MRLLRLGWAACLAVVLVLVLSVSALSASVTGVPAHAGTGADPVRLLFTGDSITHGRHLDLTWRYWIDRELHRQGVAFDAVGSQTAPYQDPGFPASRYAADFDQQHFSRTGARLSWMATQIEAEVRSQQPDVVVLVGGVNDFRYGATVPQVQASMRAWVAAVRRAGSPRIVVGTVLRTGSDAVSRLVDRYDAALPGLVAGLSTPESPIFLTDTGVGWRPDATYTTDGLHPSATGEALIAGNLSKGLVAAGVLRTAFVPPKRVAWQRTERASVSVSGRTATIRFPLQALSAGTVQLRQSGKAWRTVATNVKGVAKVAVEPGRRYAVRLQVRRYYMVGPWGPVTSFGVAAAPVAPTGVRWSGTTVRWHAVTGATSYVVRHRTGARQRWTTVTTTATAVRVPKSTKRTLAEVRVVTDAGTSAWRRASR